MWKRGNQQHRFPHFHIPGFPPPASIVRHRLPPIAPLVYSIPAAYTHSDIRFALPSAHAPLPNGHRYLLSHSFRKRSSQHFPITHPRLSFLSLDISRVFRYRVSRDLWRFPPSWFFSYRREYPLLTLFSMPFYRNRGTLSGRIVTKLPNDQNNPKDIHTTQ